MKRYGQSEMQDPPKGYTQGANVASNRLKAGMVVAYEYENGGIPRRYFIEILGFTGASEVSLADREQQRTVRWASVKEALQAAEVTSLKALDKRESRYEHSTHMVARDLQDGSEGAWFYLYKGKWSRGSGADQCLFYRLDQVEQQAS